MKVYNTEDVLKFALALGFENTSAVGGHKYYTNKVLPQLTLSISGHDRKMAESVYKSNIRQIALFLRIENDYKDNPRISPKYQEKLKKLTRKFPKMVEDVECLANGEFKFLIPPKNYTQIERQLQNTSDDEVLRYVKEKHIFGEIITPKDKKTEKEDK